MCVDIIKLLIVRYFWQANCMVSFEKTKIKWQWCQKVVFNSGGGMAPSLDLLLSFSEKSLSSDWTSSLINSSDVGHEFPGTALKSNNI